MKTLITYINENISQLKDNIKSKIDEINNEDLLKKVYNTVKINDADYKNYSEILSKRFEFIGLNNTASKAIKQKIKHYGKLEEMSLIFKNNDLLIDSAELLGGSNIYNLIYDKVKSKIKIDDKFKSLIEDLADFDLPDKSIGKGKCEILSQLFLKDINEKNKGAGDINCGNNILEYKLSTARIKGGTSTLETPKVIDTKFTELLTKYLEKNTSSKFNDKQSSLIRNNDNLDKELDDIENKIDFNIDEPNIFSSGTSIKKYFNSLFEIYDKIDGDKINEFIVTALVEEIPNSKEHLDKFINIIKENPVVDKNGLYITKSTKTNSKGKTKEINVETGILNFLTIFLLIHLYTYQFDEGWTNLILFGREGRESTTKLTGNYCVIKAEKDIEKFNKQLLNNNVFNNSYPMYNDGKKIKGSNERNWAPVILYIK